MSTSTSNPYFSCIISNDDLSLTNKDYFPFIKSLISEESDTVVIISSHKWNNVSKYTVECTSIILHPSLLLSDSTSELNNSCQKFDLQPNHLATTLSEALSLSAIHHGNILVFADSKLWEEVVSSPYFERLYYIKNNTNTSDINIPANFIEVNSKNINKDAVINTYCKHVASSEHQYFNLVNEVVNKGKPSTLANGDHVISSFGHQVKVNLQNEFPMLTAKNDSFRFVAQNLLWMIKGDTHTKTIKDKIIKTMVTWGKSLNNHTLKIKLPEGEIGYTYGHQWRNYGGLHKLEKTGWLKWLVMLMLFMFAYIANSHDALFYGAVFTYLLWPKKQKGVDQLQTIVQKIKEGKPDHELIVNSFNPHDLHKSLHSLSHLGFHFMVNNGELSMKINQVNADLLQETPHIITMYSLLTYIIADMCNLKPGQLIYSVGNVYMQDYHLQTAKKLIQRPIRTPPQLELTKKSSKKYKKVEDYTFDDFKLKGYQPHNVMNIGTLL
jgi:thymidylate synthase